MSFEIFDLVSLGVMAILLAMITLFGMVLFDLGLVSRLKGHYQYFLMLALGAGVLTFSAKMLLIVGIISFPPSQSPVLVTASNGKLNLTNPPQYRWVNISEPVVGISGYTKPISNYSWQALPEVSPESVINQDQSDVVALGKALFNDKHLSYDHSLSCASCHDLYQHAGADGLTIAIGINGQKGNRNTPSLWNTAFQTEFFWDGRADSLESQALGPLLNPVEMGMPSVTLIESRVKNQKSYQSLFKAAFGQDSKINIENILSAIATYERTLITADSPYDRFIRGDLTALTTQQIRGMSHFENFGCVSCHHGPNFSAASIFDDQAPKRIFPTFPTPFEEEYDLLLNSADQQKKYRSVWRVPSLRNVALTGPWLHNGSIDNLETVIKIMAAGQLGWSGHYLLWDDQALTLTKVNRPIPSDQEVADISAFLNALSSDKLINSRVKQSQWASTP